MVATGGEVAVKRFPVLGESKEFQSHRSQNSNLKNLCVCVCMHAAVNTLPLIFFQFLVKSTPINFFI
jgi:hypothetical protein